MFLIGATRYMIATVPSFLPGHAIAILPADFGLVCFFAILFLQYRRYVKRKRKAWLVLCRLIVQHQNTLAQRRQTCLTKDHYGIIHKKRWNTELDYFCRAILRPALNQQTLGQFWPILQKPIMRRIHRVTKTLLKRQQNALTQLQDSASDLPPEQFTTAMDPLDYERFCAGLLCKAGWKAVATPPGSDQGVDILAEQAGIHFVVQCKLYTRPVGNKAVQEIFTARQHRHAHYAAVVSNAGYTRSARQLAHATGVHLLHHSQLTTLSLEDLQPALA
ncbi:hypothetical protein GM556_00240 [Bombella sp. ESL0378]|nr:hypothetical protein [Bombella sp. ESL0378]